MKKAQIATKPLVVTKQEKKEKYREFDFEIRQQLIKTI